MRLWKSCSRSPRQPRCRSWSAGVFAFVAFLFQFGSPLWAAEIDWQVTDRFRLFDQADATSRARVERLLEQIAADRVTGVTLASRYDDFVAALSGADAAALRSSHWNPARREYSPDYLYPDRYRIRATLRGAAADESCTWYVDGREVASSSCSQPADLEVLAGAHGGRWAGRAALSVRTTRRAVYQTDVLVRDRLVVALGDSFMSGEGNPDVPADLSRLQPSERFQTLSWPTALDPARDPVRVAEWWDEPCHRSLLSWPVLAALATAAADRQRAVTLVHLACSGSTVRRGMLAPQRDLPGCPAGTDARRTCPRGRNERLGQFDQLERLLARASSRRPVDRTYLSIGGMDAGFRGLIAYSVLPARGYPLGPIVPLMMPLFSPVEIVCPYRAEASARARLCWRQPSAEVRFTRLPALYDSLAARYGDLGVRSDAVVLTTYPDILSDADNLPCHHARTDRSMRRFADARRTAEEEYRARNPHLSGPSGFEALQSMIPSFARGLNRWNFNFDHSAGTPCDPTRPQPSDSEVCKLIWFRLNLNRLVQQAAERNGWELVSSHEGTIARHGWCVDDGAHALALPVARREGTGWIWSDAAALGSFSAYRRTNGRWFRTPNDSFMAQYGGRDRIVQGAFHPTLQAHIAYAEAIARAE